MEYKDQAAEALARRLPAEPRLEDAAMACVSEHFRRRGVDPGFQPGRSFDLRASRPGVTGADRRLGWLRTQVAPTVRHVVEAKGFVAAWDALGLADLVDVAEVDLQELLRGATRGR